MEITNLGKNQKRMLKLAHTIQKRILKLVKSGEEQDIYITSKYLLTKSSLIYKRKTIFPEKSGRHYLDQVIQAQVSNHGIMIMFPLKLSTDDTSQRNVLPKLHHLNLISRKHHTYPNWEAMYKPHDILPTMSRSSQRLRKCPTVKTSGAWLLKSRHSCGLDPGSGKNKSYQNIT